MEKAINRQLDGFKNLRAEIDIINRERQSEMCARLEREREEGEQVVLPGGAEGSVREVAENQIQAHLTFIFANDDARDHGEEEENNDENELNDARRYKTDSTWGISMTGDTPPLIFTFASYYFSFPFKSLLYLIGSKMDPIRISCVKQRIIFEYIEIIIRALFCGCPEPSDDTLPCNDSLKTDFLDLCNDYKQCIHILNYKGKSHIHTRAPTRTLVLILHSII